MKKLLTSIIVLTAVGIAVRAIAKNVEIDIEFID